MQAALQRHVDSSISKTVNCPPDLPFEAFQDVYLQAYDLGLKGCTTFRPNPVTGSVLTAGSASGASPAGTTATVPPAAPVATSRAGRAAPAASPPAPPAPAQPAAVAADQHVEAPGIVYMSRPLERDAVLGGYTYKLKWPGSDHAIYVTINDIERDGRQRPFEIFINTKNLEHFAWTVALTRMISAVFRRGGDVSFVVEELKAVFDPQGGHWIGGRYVPSLLAAIGEVIEAHMRRTGFLQAGATSTESPDPIPAVVVSQAAESAAAAGAPDETFAERTAHRAVPVRHDPARAEGTMRLDPVRQPVSGHGHAASRAGIGSPTPRARACPRCYRPGLVKQEGCWVCHTCGYSRCG
jgi:ribonucleoside-diphosphate reductase alpha chain